MDFQDIQGSCRKHGTIKGMMEENAVKILFTKMQPRLGEIHERWSSAARVSNEKCGGVQKRTITSTWKESEL